MSRLFPDPDKPSPGTWAYGNGAVWSDCNGDGASAHEVCSYCTEADGILIAAVPEMVGALALALRELKNAWLITDCVRGDRFLPAIKAVAAALDKAGVNTKTA